MMNSFLNRKQQITKLKDNLRLIDHIKEDNYFNKKIKIPDDMMISCSKCSTPILTDDLIKQQFVCPKCRYHHKVSAYQRIKLTFDSFKEHDKFLREKTFSLSSYKDKIDKYREKTDLIDSVVTGIASIKSIEIAVAVMDSYFMMGSMGQTVGEKITRIIEYATKRKLPLIIFSTSGGARMQEGIIALMQMAKISSAISKYKEDNLFISVLTHPTTGGVSASFASEGDITIAEPNTLIGFAGKRVIQNTISQELPENFQTSEFLLEHGFLDLIVEREELKETLYKLLVLHNYDDGKNK